MDIIENNTKYLNHGRKYSEKIYDFLPQSELKVTEIQDGFILPKSEIYISKGGVTDANKCFVSESRIDNEGSYIRIDGAYSFEEYSDEYYDVPVIYLGYFFRHWGHFLMDCTTRMWILLDDKYNGYKVAFPNHPANVRDGNYNRFLQLIGVDEERVVKIDVPTRFSTIIVPSESRIQIENRHTKAWYDIFDRACQNAVYEINKIPKKVYFSRGKMDKPELGESEIEHNFALNGYKVVYPELLSLDEQIGIFRHTEEVASTNSSICMNVVFAREGLKWIVINKYSLPHQNFAELRYEKNLDLTYVDAFDDRLNFYGNMIGSLPYLVSFNKNLKKMFEDNDMMYETFSKGYRIGNICSYIIKCMIQKPKVLIRVYSAKCVRWMKRCTPWLYRFIKRVMV